MSRWEENELRKIAESEELSISPLREDGVTYRKPTTIWSVAVDDALYVRGHNGQKSRWYRDARRQKVGRISAGGITNDVTFEPVDGPINDRIDGAYRTKYQRSPYLSPMLGAGPRSATLKVLPRAPHGE